MDIGGWLRSLGLEKYEAVLRENEIDDAVLHNLTEDHLRELGFPLGARLKLLDAIAALGSSIPAASTSARSPPSSPASLTTLEKAEATAERRQVTVMFSDLVGSTALSARMDPEDLREVISAYQKCVAETMQRFGGFVAKYMGDGVLVYFGYPQAHEDDAERAVRAGLELVTVVNALKTRAPLQTRIGIATGLVVVGDLIGRGSAQEQAVVGETPNLAARLQGAAEPNTVVIAESTRRLLGNLFDLQDLSAQDLKGIASPVRAWAVLRPASIESRFEALHASGLTELVGREEEIELLLRRWSKAKKGEGQVVLLSGEPGIGKSRLTATLLERLATEPHTRMRYFCSPQHTDSAFYPIISQLERAARLAHDDTPQAKLDKLDAALAQTSTSRQDAALFAEMLPLPNDGRYPTLDLTPEQRRQRTLQALVSQMEALARQNPVLMIFEDAHWTDPTSLEVFGRVVDRVRSLRVLLIVTFRPDFDPPWVGRAYVTFLAINRLEEREILAIIEGVVGNKPLPANIRQDIIERTDGVPLFVEEMTKAVLEAESQGAVEHLAAAVPSSALAVPASLQASLMARLDRLGPAKEVAQIGAAIGREFSHALLSAVVSKPESELVSALDRLMATGLLFRQGLPPHASYMFKHALVQDAAYGTLLRSRRQQLHSHIAATLEGQFPEVIVAHPQLIAQHCVEAGLNEKAVSYWLKAGQQALARSAVTEAASQLQKGLHLLASLPDGDWRRQRELDLLLLLRPALIATKGYSTPDVGETIARAQALAEQLGRSDDVVPLLHAQFAYHLHRGELRLALPLAEQMEQIGQTQNDVAALLLGRSGKGMTRHFLGQLVAARTLLEQSQDLGDPAHLAEYTLLTGTDQHVVQSINLAYPLTLLGFIDQARARVNEALLEARRLEHAHTLAQVLNRACEFSSPREAQRYAEEAMALSIEHGFPYWLAVANVNRGRALTALGQTQEGVALMTQGLLMLRAAGHVLQMSGILTDLAKAHARLGQPVEGLNCLAEAAQIIESTDHRVREAEVYRVRGDLLNATGDLVGAEQCYHQALAIAQRQSAKLFELRAATSLARLWRDQGKRAEARDLLVPIYGWFTEGFDTPVLKEAKALLEQLVL